MNLYKLIIECLAVGIMVVIVGYFIGWATSNNNNTCPTWYKDKFILLNLFIIGVVIHLLCEISKINKWYCKNGHACTT